MITKISKTTAKKFLLFKQFLLPPRQLYGKRGIETVFRALRSVQYDPQNPCGRNVDIFLQARVSGIHPSDYYHWLYTERNGIEVYDKELCVIPIEDVPLCRKLYPPSRKRKLETFIESNKEQLEQLLEHVEKNGTIRSNDINDERRVDIFWETARWGKVALDSLWKIGKLVICDRKNGFKYYDLPSKIYGDNFVWSYNNINEISAEQVIRRLQSVGMLPISGAGQGWLRLGSGKEISYKISNLIQKGVLKEIIIEGLKNHYVAISWDLEKFLMMEDNDKMEKKISFLAPLDNLLWDRKMIKDIFDFDYKWEVYTPKESRKFGHYVLPILYGAEFIGRIEPILQKESYLEIKGLWLERGFRWDNNTCSAFWDYMELFKKYLNTGKIKWSCNSPPLPRHAVFAECEVL